MEGVVVRIYDEDNKTIITTLTSDADGKVQLLLPPGTYSIRSYRYQAAFQNNTKFVVACNVPNVFDVYGRAFQPPESTDPRLCRVSGFFRTPSGAPAPNLDLRFAPQFKPILLDSFAVISERVSTRTNDKGYVELDLIRCASYDVNVQGMEGIYRSIDVPDGPSANLPDLLFPYVSAIELLEAPPTTLQVGAVLAIPVRIKRSDGNYFPDARTASVSVYSESPFVLRSVLGESVLCFEALSVGTARILGRRDDTGIVVIPERPLQGVPFTIEVVALCTTRFFFQLCSCTCPHRPWGRSKCGPCSCCWR